MAQNRTYDVICLGRAAVDLYSQQLGETLEDARSFNKYLGGSSGNMAVGMARQGLRVAMLTRVGDEQMGRFVSSELAANGVDVSHVIADPERLTGLALLGLQDQETFPLLFYRENCADMAICEQDFDEGFIASAKALVISGTHFSSTVTGAVCRRAVEFAQRSGTKAVLDIDYRPVLWGLTAKGDGETRFIKAERVTAHLQSIISLFDLVVGTEEEIHIAGGSTDTLEAVSNIRLVTDATIVVKRGPLGCVVFDKLEIPVSLDGGISVPGRKVKVLNVLGAGDAFISGFMRGWIEGDSLAQCGALANACGAIVVSRHGCSPAMPTRIELDAYMASEQIYPASDIRLNHLHRVTTRTKERLEICALAFDHRQQFEEMAASVGAMPERIPKLKSLIAKAALDGAEQAKLDGSAGVLIDDTFGMHELASTRGRDLWIGRPVEVPGSRPLEFEAGDNVGLTLISWPSDHVVKCLVFYHPDDTETIVQYHHSKLLELYQACVETRHELLLEVVPPVGMSVDDQTMARSLENLYAIGIYPDWWKLPAQQCAGWQAVDKVIRNNDAYCRGVILLGLGASDEILAESFKDAAQYPICKGFAVGRSIFAEPAKNWLAGSTDDSETIEAITKNYLRVIDLWRQRHQA